MQELGWAGGRWAIAYWGLSGVLGLNDGSFQFLFGGDFDGSAWYEVPAYDDSWSLTDVIGMFMVVD